MNRTLESVVSLLLSICPFCGLAGCSGISIAPSCPDTLTVGGSAPVVSNVINPGAVPKYAWTVDPPGAGTFTDPTKADTTFAASAEGNATVTLTASDGLFQVKSWCHIQISATPAGGLTVQLTSLPSRPTAGSVITLACTTTSATPAQSFDITQTSGAALTITNTGSGVATVTPAAAGDYGFRCIGTASDGSTSDPATLTITVETGSKPGGRGRD
ncbi:MAG: hypothetical protein HY287_13650 [Planctomycetes bacterium]|nr:hypothetical protein [Planctomycetota bacterium]MBI3835367.1 hypothetical protein [Planctomycetota bacterium]